VPQIHYEGKTYEGQAGESVLDSLLRHGLKVPYSCKAGACQTCLMQARDGTVPPKSQTGLKETLAAQKYFLACVCHPEGDIHVCTAGDETKVSATVASIEDIGASVLRVKLNCAQPLGHRAGQYLSLLREDGLARSYSIASRPEDGLLELHVRLIPNGAMSTWLKTEAKPGASVRVQGPSGNCFYVAGKPEQPLLLAGTGTGLAPLYGIAQDALANGHTGPIVLYHGARNPSGLYLIQELKELAAKHANFTYNACVLDDASDGLLGGALDTVLLAREKNLAQTRIFLCGDPALVMGLRKKLFMAGASLKQIFADAFLPSVK